MTLSSRNVLWTPEELIFIKGNRMQPLEEIVPNLSSP
jgi:hypothetical protein